MIIVIPTIRNLDFLKKWPEFTDHRIIVVEDHEEREISIPDGFRVEVYTRKDIRKELGKDAWIIPNKSAGIASFGFLMASRLDDPLIYTIDDDCIPFEEGVSVLEGHESNLVSTAVTEWVTTNGMETRGYPYGIRNGKEVVVSHGLWAGLQDYDAMTHLVGCEDHPYIGDTKPISKGAYYPMCRMNLAFKSRVAVLMYSLLQGEGWPVNRFEDIWAGVLSKKVCDHLGLAHVSGLPKVYHTKQFEIENMLKTAQVEMNGIVEHERFWRAVDEVELTATTPKDCYLELANKIKMEGDYWKKNKEAMSLWANLF